METPIQIAKRVREVFLDGKWIANTNYKELLAQLTWKQATHKVGSLNTLAALTYHVNYYVAGVLNVFENGTLEIRDKYSFDLPEITGQTAWDELMEHFCANAEKLAKQIESMPDEKLAAIFVDEKYGTYQRNLEGLIEHSYYHLGQLSLIKKMVMEFETAS